MPDSRFDQYLNLRQDDHLLLAGGGHSHALILLRWAMNPHLRPKGLITLVSKNSTTLYSGMVPGLIAGQYKYDELSIDLHCLTSQAGVSFVLAKIVGLDLIRNCLLLQDRPPIYFGKLSLNVGAETLNTEHQKHSKKNNLVMPIKPLEPAIEWLISQDIEELNPNPSTFTVIGAGLAGLEVALALRQRWPNRTIELHSHHGEPNPQLRSAISQARIRLVSGASDVMGPALLCTGNRAPVWLEKSGLPINASGRILTTQTFQAIDHPHIFAVGDCGVIQDNSRPASGVWAVRSSTPLARNLEASSRKARLAFWSPQRRGLQLMGGRLAIGRNVAWAFWGGLMIGPHPLLWKWKQHIDKGFMAKFVVDKKMFASNYAKDKVIACRGCASKVASKPLKNALKQADLFSLSDHPEDAAFIGSHITNIIQSVDGFPALVSDPWLNGRITALHACSDLWASGALPISAQVIVTLPVAKAQLQQELLAHSLAGIQSALAPQRAGIIGGHTIEDRSIPSEPLSLGIQLALSVNGVLGGNEIFWTKNGLQSGDVLLLSRGIGSGVIFAAAMSGQVDPHFLDAALAQMTTSQHVLLDPLFKMQNELVGSKLIHACTDITGFGLLGHIGEMLNASNQSFIQNGLDPLRIRLEAESIPSFQGSLSLLEEGFSSSFAPANRSALKLLQPNGCFPASVEIELGNISTGSKKHKSILDLIIDPQTCGPLLLACSPEVASNILSKDCWYKIGDVI